jgi:hypothetical protein
MTVTDDDRLTAAEEVVRGASKWLVGALGAIGAVLIAGSQLSSIGTLPGDSFRFRVALLGLVGALAAVLAAIWVVVEQLVPRRWTLSELSREWTASGASVDGGIAKRIPKFRFPEIDWLAKNPEHLGGFGSIPAIKEAFDDADVDADLADIIDLINAVQAKAGYRGSEIRFRRLRWKIVVAMIVAGIGIASFAWAANPPASDDRPPSLRNANLTGADLRGADLAHADLSHANFSNADLGGATLEEANIDGAIWMNTICPDGVTSDAVAHGTAEESCEGHLLPTKGK